jgi:hypothetical protein
MDIAGFYLNKVKKCTAVIEMFDGTDLSLAYGSASFDQMSLSSDMQHPSMPQKPSVQAQPSPPPPPPPPPEVMYNPPPQIFMQQQSPQLPVHPPASDDTLWNRISQKKFDVLKLFVLSLVVLLGIALDRLATHYMSTYISGSLLSDVQEFMVRLSYPVIVLIVLWIIKASA